MPNNHSNKYFSKMLLGISLVTAGIFLSMFIVTNITFREDWFFWAFAVAILVNAGLLFLCNSIVHKIKADLIRKQKHLEQRKTFTADKSDTN